MNDPRPDATMWMADESIMPDFRATLEARLRQAASASVTPATKAEPSHTHTRRFTALTAVAAILAIAIVVVAASDRHGAPAAYGRPLITLEPPVRHIPAARRREVAKLLDVAFGARLRHVWAIHALGGTAYLVQGDIGWCLQEPRFAASCTFNADFAQGGIAVFGQDQFIAAVPQGVRSPTLTRPDGTTTTLQPDQGVASANHLQTGTTVTIYNRDGTTHTWPFLSVPPSDSPPPSTP